MKSNKDLKLKTRVKITGETRYHTGLGYHINFLTKTVYHAMTPNVSYKIIDFFKPLGSLANIAEHKRACRTIMFQLNDVG